MIGHHSPTLPKPVHLSVNEPLRTTKTAPKPLVNRTKKVHLYSVEPVERQVNHFQQHKDAA